MKTLALIFLTLFATTSHAAYQRLASETYPGGGGVATNAVSGITTNGAPVALDSSRVAHIVFPTGGSSGGGVTTQAVENIVDNWSSTNHVPHASDAEGGKVLSDIDMVVNGDINATNGVLYNGNPVVYGISTNGMTYTGGNVDLSSLKITEYLKTANVTDGTLYITNASGVGISFAGGTGGGVTTQDVENIVSSSSVTNGGAKAYADDTFLKTHGDGELYGNLTLHGYLWATEDLYTQEDVAAQGSVSAGKNVTGSNVYAHSPTGRIGWANSVIDVGWFTYEPHMTIRRRPHFHGTTLMESDIDFGEIAFLPDIPSTNGLASTNYVIAATNNLASTNYVNAATNGLASTNYVNAATNGLASTNYVIAATNNLASTNYVNESIADLSSTNYVNESIAKFVNTDVCWSKPNLWCLEFQLGYTATVVGHVSTVTNDYGAIYETKSVTYAYGNYADLYPEVYDEYRLDPVIVTNYICTTAGGTISPTGRLTTTGDGVYHCIATDANGVSSAVDVPIQNTLQEIAETPIYTADVTGTDRKTSNDAAKTLMTSPTSAGTGTYEGITYNIWNFFTQPVWAATQAGSVGNTKAFALGTTVMASAAHYAWHSGGTQVVGGTTVTKGAAERLYDWALAHGWTKAQLDEMDIRDIEVIPLTAGTIPTSDLPYLMTEAQLDASYGSLAGVQCWTAVQAFAQPITRVYTSPYGTSWSDYSESRSQAAVKPWRDDITAILATLGTTYPVHSGDSGHPIYFKDASGRYVLTSHYHYVGGGPNYIKGFPVIKAYVQAHGGTVREIP